MTALCDLRIATHRWVMGMSSVLPDDGLCGMSVQASTGQIGDDRIQNEHAGWRAAQA